MTEKLPAPFTAAWHRKQPPERVASQVERYQRMRSTLPWHVRKRLQVIFENISIEDAREIDRDLERLLPTYGTHYPPSGRLCRDIADMAQEAAALHRDLSRYEHGTENMKARALEKMLGTCARRWRGKWLGRP